MAMVRDLCAEARQTRTDAESALVNALAEGRPIVEEVTWVFRTRGQSAWWDSVIDTIERYGIEPGEAVIRSRNQALHVLTTQTAHRSTCPFEQAYALAALDAARIFYRDSEDLADTIIARKTACTSGIPR
jgi:hypothetical protein